MFLRRQNKNVLDSEALNSCEDNTAYLKTIADEKCRVSKVKLGYSNFDSFIWSQKSCADASYKVVEQAEQCIRLQTKGPSATG